MQETWSRLSLMSHVSDVTFGREPQPRAGLPERRRAPRIQILGRLHGHVVGIDTPVTLRDISLVGMLIETSCWFPLGAAHRFRLTLGDDLTAVMIGRVVRCNYTPNSEGAGVYVTGIEFVNGNYDHGGPSIADLIQRLSV